MENNFEIKRGYWGIIITKDDNKFSIEKGADGDIWFNSLQGEIELPISFYSRNQEERGSYNIFEDLMKAVIGKYILSGDNEDEYSCLPKDFIDLERKIITWHSDSEDDNILKLQFQEKRIIISIIKDKNTRNSDNTIKVRIRTDGSNYGNYYQEFEKIFNKLYHFAYQDETTKNSNNLTNTIKPIAKKKTRG